MKFILGDKVKVIVCDRMCRKYKDKIGTITMVDRIKKGLSGYWDYEVTFEDRFIYPFSSEEIKIIIHKGQQLIFEFME